MKPAIDNINLDEDSFELEAASAKRETIKRSAAGLDGQISIDLGLRERKIVLKGELKARSHSELQNRISQIDALIDGNLHTLKCADGSLLCNLIIESFETDLIIKSGTNVSCNFKITLTQQG